MNRQQRRYAEKLNKKSNKELMKELQKLFPNQNMDRKIQGEMSYQQFIDNVKLTPEMLNELNQHEMDNRQKNIKFNII